MTFIQLVERKHMDGMGKHFLESAVSRFVSGEISKAFELFRQGLTILTCDCPRGNWKRGIESSKSIYTSKTDINFSEFNFCKAFLLSYNDDVKSNYVALDSIEQFLVSNSQDSIGFYIKGKILTNLEKYDEALESFNYSNELEFSPRTLYRIGRLKEQYLKTDGIEELYIAFIENQSSACCCRVLQQYSFIKGIRIQDDLNNSDNILIQGFNTYSDEWNFQREFEHLFNSRMDSYLYQETASDLILNDFVEHLISSKGTFILKIEDEYEDYDENEGDYDEPDYEPDYDEMYFDAMTDGQLGRYDEFLENGGDLDYIDDWAGR